MGAVPFEEFLRETRQRADAYVRCGENDCVEAVKIERAVHTLWHRYVDEKRFVHGFHTGRVDGEEKLFLFTEEGMYHPIIFPAQTRVDASEIDDDLAWLFHAMAESWLPFAS